MVKLCDKTIKVSYVMKTSMRHALRKRSNVNLGVLILLTCIFVVKEDVEEMMRCNHMLKR